LKPSMTSMGYASLRHASPDLKRTGQLVRSPSRSDPCLERPRSIVESTQPASCTFVRACQGIRHSPMVRTVRTPDPDGIFFFETHCADVAHLIELKSDPAAMLRNPGDFVVSIGRMAIPAETDSEGTSSGLSDNRRSSAAIGLLAHRRRRVRTLHRLQRRAVIRPVASSTSACPGCSVSGNEYQPQPDQSACITKFHRASASTAKPFSSASRSRCGQRLWPRPPADLSAVHAPSVMACPNRIRWVARRLLGTARLRNGVTV